jgi:phosphoinositide-3-kinase regulatory subunit 4
MIALDPAQRPSFDMLLHTARGGVFPEAFYAFLNNYVGGITEMPSPSPFASTAPASGATGPSATLTVTSPVVKGAPAVVPAEDFSGVLPGDSDHRMDRIWTDYESVVTYLLPSPEDADELVGGAVKVEWSIPSSYSVRFPAASRRKRG